MSRHCGARIRELVITARVSGCGGKGASLVMRGARGVVLIPCMAKPQHRTSDEDGETCSGHWQAENRENKNHEMLEFVIKKILNNVVIS